MARMVAAAFLVAALLVAGCGGSGKHAPSADVRLARTGILRIGDLGASRWGTIHRPAARTSCLAAAGLHQTAQARAAFYEGLLTSVDSRVRVFASVAQARMATARLSTVAARRCLGREAVKDLTRDPTGVFATGRPVVRSLQAAALGAERSLVSIDVPLDQNVASFHEFVVVRVGRAVLDAYLTDANSGTEKAIGNVTRFRPLLLAVRRLEAA